MWFTGVVSCVINVLLIATNGPYANYTKELYS